MWDKFRFYFNHSLNDMRVNGQRTFFAILCIAAGVAAIVSLQTLGVMATDTLTESLQATNRADLRAQAVFAGPQDDDDSEDRATLQKGVQEGVLETQRSAFFGQSFDFTVIRPEAFRIIQTWFDTEFPGQFGVLTYQQRTGGGALNAGVSVGIPARRTSATFVTAFPVEAQVYPLYGEANSEDSRPLRELIKEPTDAVISRKLARQLKAEVGDKLTIADAASEFTVRGIVPDETEGGFENIFASLFGYVYLDVKSAEIFDVAPGATQIYIKLNDPARTKEIQTAFNARFPYLQTTSTEDLREQNEQTGQALNQLVTVMGLVSLLIGGIGIVNTMQVVVRRRTLEVAVLKTLGLEGRQVTLLFLVEAFLMGLIGSVAGVVLGWLMTFAIKGVAEGFLARELAFRIVPGPAINGTIVGTLITTVFGFLPTLSAGQVRPGVVLRPTDAIVPRAGRLSSLGALLVVILAISLIATTILGNFGVALTAVAGAFVAAGILYVLLWALIWVVGRFLPTFRNIDLKIALRSMLATRQRGAITLLALVIGVFSLSLITLFAATITNLFNAQLVSGTGGNVIVFAGGNALEQVKKALTTVPGVKSYSTTVSYPVKVVNVQSTSGEQQTWDTLQESAVASAALPVDANGKPPRVVNQITTIAAREITAAAPARRIIKGRDLAPTDAGKQVIVLPSPSLLAVYESRQPAFLDPGIDVGDSITFDIEQQGFLGVRSNKQLTFEVIGLFDSRGVSFGFNSNAPSAPFDAFPGLTPPQVSAIVDMEEEHIPELQQALQNVMGTFVLETKFLNNLLNTLLNQFTTFPILVAALGLLVGGIVIANSVALTTMERRREIAIMKAVGLQRERVLGMLLMENAVMGLIGGLIGVGIGLVALIILQAGLQAQSAAPLPNVVPYGPALLLMLMCIGVALAAALATAWGASGEKPLNVLRYE